MKGLSLDHDVGSSGRSKNGNSYSQYQANATMTELTLAAMVVPTHHLSTQSVSIYIKVASAVPANLEGGTCDDANLSGTRL